MRFWKLIPRLGGRSLCLARQGFSRKEGDEELSFVCVCLCVDDGVRGGGESAIVGRVSRHLSVTWAPLFLRQLSLSCGHLSL